MPTFPQDFALKYRRVWSPKASDAAMDEFFNRLGRYKNRFHKSSGGYFTRGEQPAGPTCGPGHA
jgi:hypothetical protein